MIGKVMKTLKSRKTKLNRNQRKSYLRKKKVKMKLCKTDTTEKTTIKQCRIGEPSLKAKLTGELILWKIIALKEL